MILRPPEAGACHRRPEDTGRQMLQQALVDLGFEKVEVKEILADKWQGSGVFGGLLLLDVTDFGEPRARAC